MAALYDGADLLVSSGVGDWFGEFVGVEKNINIGDHVIFKAQCYHLQKSKRRGLSLLLGKLDFCTGNVSLVFYVEKQDFCASLGDTYVESAGSV